MEEGLNKQHLEQVIQNLGNEYLWVAIGVAVTFFCRDLIMNFVQGMLLTRLHSITLRWHCKLSDIRENRDSPLIVAQTRQSANSCF